LVYTAHGSPADKGFNRLSLGENSIPYGAFLGRRIKNLLLTAQLGQ
jgi:hypothetical protein